MLKIDSNNFVDKVAALSVELFRLHESEMIEAYQEIKALKDENEKLRMLLWLRHGCSALYGDDGEMQCGKCRIDFKRDTAESIEQKWYIAGYSKLAKK